ncbi:MAG TPA: sigma-70 family RNA polymerase sigma factor [Pyrinomonadaceae bacterium]|jgi:RNA polymerase sigma-70 factor (ECF subfamily)|nr:sigma-70 family RNA polymerase sigma factor [Pyrinomonadaceae bacterium]
MPRPTTLADRELVSSVELGDKLAEAALYEKYSDRLYFLALSELHSPEEAEDVRAETFTRVLLALRDGKLRKPDSLSSFIVGIALNVIRESRRQRSGTEPLEDHESKLVGEASPERAFLDQEVSRSIEEVAKQLKPREREFLKMYYYDELPKREIARVLGVKEERLRLIKSRALQKFREIYRKLQTQTDTE